MHSYTLSLRHQLRTPVAVVEMAPPTVDVELGGDLARRTGRWSVWTLA